MRIERSLLLLAIIGGPLAFAEHVPGRVDPGKRPESAPAAGGEFPTTVTKKDAPAGTQHGIVSLRPPESMACTAAGVAVGVVDTRPQGQLLLTDDLPTPTLKLWQFAPSAGPHPANGTLDKYRPIHAITLSSDAKYA